MTDLTAASVVLMMSVQGLFPTPVQIQGFAAEDIYDMDEIERVQTLMGADGILSGGFVFKEQMQSISLQADSLSAPFFDAWDQNQVAGRRTYPGNGVLTIPSLGIKFVQTRGFLKTFKLPGAKAIMQPRRFRLTWQTVVPQAA